ncbi:MAG: hypothetical protein Q9196_004532 [Gyalolechia fulgens]
MNGVVLPVTKNGVDDTATGLSVRPEGIEESLAQVLVHPTRLDHDRHMTLITTFTEAADGIAMDTIRASLARMKITLKVFSKNVVSATSDHRRLQLYAMSLVGVVSLTPLTATKTSLGPCSTAVIFRRRSNPTRIPGVGATPENTATLSTGVTRTNPAEGSVWWMFKAYEIGMEHLKGRAV